MHRYMNHFARGALDRTLCGGGGLDPLDTHMEVLDEDEPDGSLRPVEEDGISENSLLSTPPRHRTKLAAREFVEADEDENILYATPPSSRIMSPHSSVSSWSPEPMSPLEWKEDDCQTRDMLASSEADEYSDPPVPFLPSLFSPWMCVFDLDAACGSGNSRSDDGRNTDPSSPPSQLPKDWNDLLPPLDLSQWFGSGTTSTIQEESLERSSLTPDELHASPNTSLLPPFRPVPLYPTRTNVVPHQYFTNFASDHSIEAIFVPSPPVCCVAAIISVSWSLNRFVLQY